MGRDMEELGEALPRLPYKVQAAQRGLVEVLVNGETFTPQELSAELLKKVKLRSFLCLKGKNYTNPAPLCKP